MAQVKGSATQAKRGDVAGVGRHGPIAAAAFLVLAVLIPVSVIDPAVLGGQGAVPWAAVSGRGLVIGYTAWRLAGLIALGEPRWFATIFWLFTYVWMGLAGLAQLLAGRNPFGLRVDQDSDFRTSMVILLGIVVFDFAHRSAAGHEARTAATTERRVITPNSVLLVATVAIVMTPLLLSLQGGLGVYLQTRDAVRESLDAASGGSTSLALSGMLKAAIQVPPAVALLGCIVLLASHSHLRRQPAWWLVVLLIVSLNVLVNNPIGNSRFWFGTVALGSLFVMPCFRRPRGYRILVAGLLLALTVAFPYADYFRTEGGFEQRQQAVSSFMVSKLDYDATAQITYAMGLYEAQGPDYGRQILGAAAFAVPRSIWENKPQHTGEVIAQFSGFHFTNVSAPLWAEAYIAGGLLGVVLIFLGVGLVTGRADRASVRAGVASSGSWVVVMVAPLAAYSMILLRGALLATIAQGVVLALVLLLLARRTRSETSQRPQPRARQSNVWALKYDARGR